MFILKKGHQPGVYVPLRALFLVSQQTFEILRLYKYTNYNKYHSLRGNYLIMHSTYRVDENKILVQNQSQTNGSGADESASLRQCQHHRQTAKLVKSIPENPQRPVFSERRQVPRLKVYLHSYRKKNI